MDQLKTSPSLADEESLCAIRTGGPAGDKAIMALYALYHKDIRASLLHLMSRNGKYKTNPSDIVHDSFVIMLHKIRDNSITLISVRAYWFGVARHLLLNQSKKKDRLCLVEDLEESYITHDITPEYLLLTNERFKRLEQSFVKCGSRCCELLLLWMSDYTMEEIAIKLSLSSTAMARKIKHNCFKKLKSIIVNSNIFKD